MDELQQKFNLLSKNERDGIVSKLEDFITAEVQDRLDNARNKVSEVCGKGTTIRQSDEISRFYAEIRIILTQALRKYLDDRINEFKDAIFNNAKSVAPKIRKSSENLLQQRLEAIESSLQVAAEGQKEQVAAYLTRMIAIFRNFAANPEAMVPLITNGINNDINNMSKTEKLQEQHYEIAENAIGYTYERIFRPYIDNVSEIIVEDPYIRLPYQVDNFSRFCAIAIRYGKVQEIKLVSGKQLDDDTIDADNRLEILKKDLNGRGIKFSFYRDSALHDREFKFDNNWIVKIGRGLDIYIKPENKISLEFSDFSLRRCKQTKVDIYKNVDI